MPNLYIISGCNGAGKTTASFTVLPEMLGCREFVNADEIARGLSPFQPEKVAVEAGRIMLQRIDELLRKKEDFAIETTLATRSYAQTIKRARESGYNVTLIYFWLASPELAIQRVKNRVAEGGHHIPEDVIRRRYKKGVKNLFELFIPICDYWIIIDNSQTPYNIVAEGQQEQELKIQSQSVWEKLKELSHE
ncbi:zeta toxin family protein [Pontibacter sp. HSC-14F20]|uniref:zeta toxin family protein n=1 Tax=Pontibacter sp. HSC-14F20 TaxID=2864136 RepID=UPI001C72C807|nr:zeta toxin family protein [Pontibacter sp. HSC-14F20]MBX0334895.1 zeta toxin family protein [Pontibacter sp. HSC-14F20]